MFAKALKPNQWLEEKEFLNKIDFYDKDYFKILAKHIANFLKNIPIAVLCTWDPAHGSIYFNIGLEHRKYIKVDPDISYKDFLTLAERWLEGFYPQYSIEEEIIRGLTDEEIFNMKEELGEKFDLNDALLIQKKDILKRKGIIRRIYLKNDEFILFEGKESFVRLSTIPLSSFLKKLRMIQGHNEDIYKYIYDNSIQIKKVEKNNKPIRINYQGLKMLNFFIINYCDLCNEKLIEKRKGIYSWGKFEIYFKDDQVEQNCLEFYYKKKGVYNEVSDMDN